MTSSNLPNPPAPPARSSHTHTHTHSLSLSLPLRHSLAHLPPWRLAFPPCRYSNPAALSRSLVLLYEDVFPSLSPRSLPTSTSAHPPVGVIPRRILCVPMILGTFIRSPFFLSISPSSHPSLLPSFLPSSPTNYRRTQFRWVKAAMVHYRRVCNADQTREYRPTVMPRDCNIGNSVRQNARLYVKCVK